MSETARPGQELKDANLRASAGEMTADNPHRVAIVTGANYSAAKAGMQGLTKDPRHRTRPVRHHRQRGGARLHRHRYDGRDRRPARHDVRGLPGHRGIRVPARRIGEVDDVAHAISFLASEGARYVSGQVIYVA